MLMRMLVQLLAYDDASPTSAPRRRSVDWTRLLQDVTVGRPAEREYDLQPLEEKTIWDGTRTTSFDETTELTLALSTLAADRYRLSWTGNGTNPEFRIDREFNAGSCDIAFEVNANATVTVSANVGAPNFADVEIGDTVLVPGLATGDPDGPFDSLNVGYWIVLATTEDTFTMRRPTGESFSGETEQVTVPTNLDLQVFSSDRVQVGDTVQISAGFAQSARRAYQVQAVTTTTLDIQCSEAIAEEEEIVPGADSFAVYSDAKHYVYIETTGDCVARFNGNTGDHDAFAPTVAEDGTVQPGMLLKTGTAWKLVLVNKSGASITVFTVGIGA